MYTPILIFKISAWKKYVSAWERFLHLWSIPSLHWKMVRSPSGFHTRCLCRKLTIHKRSSIVPKELPCLDEWTKSMLEPTNKPLKFTSGFLFSPAQLLRTHWPYSTFTNSPSGYASRVGVCRPRWAHNPSAYFAFHSAGSVGCTVRWDAAQPIVPQKDSKCKPLIWSWPWAHSIWEFNSLEHLCNQSSGAKALASADTQAALGQWLQFLFKVQTGALEKYA